MLVPKLFRDIPNSLKICDAPATEVELNATMEIRRKFVVPGEFEPYMGDVVRAIRLIKGADCYVEVGTRDRGNLAVVADVMAAKPTIVDVDYDRMPLCEAAIQKALFQKANYSFIHGDSASPDTVAKVRSAIGKKLANVIFCDSSHLYEHTLAEFDHYYDLVRPGGFLMYHDAFWEGNEQDKGKHQALLAIDRLCPVYTIFMDEPIHRIMSRTLKGDVWGGVAIIPKP